MKIFLRIIGFLAFLLGVTIVLWIGYNVFIEWQPEAKGNPILSFAVSILMMNVGILWMQGKTLQEAGLTIPRKFMGALLITAILYEVLIRVLRWIH